MFILSFGNIYISLHRNPKGNFRKLRRNYLAKIWILNYKKTKRL